jgi:hypothetical protein
LPDFKFASARYDTKFVGATEIVIRRNTIREAYCGMAEVSLKIKWLLKNRPEDGGTELFVTN